MFDRLVALIGEDKLRQIGSKRVMVLGCGGVGGYVTEALVRSGIKSITVVDYDVVEMSNLNRQIIALHSTLDKKKTDVIRERILDINLECNVKVIDKRLSVDEIEKLNLSSYDYVVDAIDDVNVKVEIAKESIDKGFNLIMSCGTAKKMHPEMLSITTLNKTSGDPLAKKIRYLLRGYDLKKIKVLSSSEAPLIEGPVLGSSAFVPSSAGLLIASYIINDIIK